MALGSSEPYLDRITIAEAQAALPVFLGCGDGDPNIHYLVRVLNELQFDAVCFGNHEADVPPEELVQRINELDGTWLNSNMPKFTREHVNKFLATRHPSVRFDK